MSKVDDDTFKAYIVHLIREGYVDKALELLSKYYGVDKPRIRVKRLKGHSNALATYSLKNKTIYVQSGEYYNNPFVILHEFYHHLRNIGGRHRGTEKNADKFASDYIDTYIRVIKRLAKRRIN